MLLAAEPGLEVVAECADGPTRSPRSRSSSPDLVFLDVQMPGATGFDVIEAVGAGRMPFVIFVTAYDSYALRAFDVHALDYLLKPFDRDRFQQALDARAPAARAADPTASSSGGCSRSCSDLKPPPQHARALRRQVRRTRVLRARRATSTGSRRPATTSSCTSAPSRTCSAKR